MKKKKVIRRPRSRPTNAQATQDGLTTAFHLVETLLKAAVERFPDDRVKPGVSLAFVNGGFYGSVCRYPNGDKQVAFKHYGATAEEVVVKLGYFLALPRDDARRALRAVLP